MKTVAIQGVEGAYHELAARNYFAGRGESEVAIRACAQFRDVITAVQADPEVVGILAIENTIAGSLLQNHELIRRSGLRVVGEHKLHISHCLAALGGESLGSIVEVRSHPIALMQCGEFLAGLQGVKVVEGEDTALSAREIAEGRWKGQAAVCSRYAAEMYGLVVLAEGIETNKRNFTRFLLVADPQRAGEWDGEGEMTKASVVFTLPHTEGSLSKVLTILSFYDLNLTKIQSLPIIGREWEYLFYVDVAFGDPVRYRQGLDAVRPLMKDLKILGEYKEERL
jgi:prephenate dehydratase